jgi:hypothetical protein
MAMKPIATLCTVLLLVIACNECPECPECPDCPTCPETLTCPEGYTLKKSPLVWECIEDVEPPPDLGLYVNIERARAVAVHLDSNDQRVYNVFAGWRDPEYVLGHCPWSVGVNAFFPMTRAEMEAFAAKGEELNGRVEDLIRDLPITNRRCNPNHAEHHPDFCEKSNVKKSRLDAFLSEWNPHLEEATELRDIAQEDPIGQICEFDSIKGWCECRGG